MFLLIDWLGLVEILAFSGATPTAGVASSTSGIRPGYRPTWFAIPLLLTGFS